MLQVFRNGDSPQAEATSLLKPGCLLYPQVRHLSASLCPADAGQELPDEGDSSLEESSESRASSISSGVPDESVVFDWCRGAGTVHSASEHALERLSGV